MKTPGILLLIGGLLTLIVGIGYLALGSFFAIGAGALGGLLGAVIGGIGGLQIVFGILLILSGLWADKKPAWAWVGLIFSLLALLVGGGLIIGPFIANIGAALAFKEMKPTAK